MTEDFELWDGKKRDVLLNKLNKTTKRMIVYQGLELQLAYPNTSTDWLLWIQKETTHITQLFSRVS
jgi:hypothetical protein